MIDIDKLESLAKDAIARGEEIGEESWYSKEEYVFNMLMHPDDATFAEATAPAAILALIAEVRALREFHGFFRDRCEGPFAQFGMSAIDAYNEAARAIKNT
jgi:hypothetical protein